MNQPPPLIIDDTKIPSLKDVFAECHRELDELFFRHQEAVLLGRFNEARRLLDEFKEPHHLHMRLEDEVLIPKLAELGDRGRWRASLYSDEHAKIEELLAKTEADLHSLSLTGLSGTALRREIISFLDDEKTFKGLCEHHQQREESGILPELDEQTDAVWRASIIEPFLAAWRLEI